MRTDYESTQISTLDAKAELLNPAVLSSGSQRPGLVASLSGDVVLSDAKYERLLVVDRLGTDVITSVDSETGEIGGQVRVSEGHSANPQDVEPSEGELAWVSRMWVNSEVPILRSNDLVEVDLSAFSLTGRRVDLTELNSASGGLEVFARPGRMAKVGRQLYVGLTLLSENFRSAGPGHLASVNLDTLEVESIPLPEDLVNCGSLAPIPGQQEHLLVSCIGRPFSPAPEVRASSGLVVFSTESASVETWRPAATDPLAVYEATPISRQRAVGIEFGPSGDRAFLIDLSGQQAPTLLVAITERFFLGRGSLDASRELLLIPDRNGVLYRFRQTADGFERIEDMRFTDGPLGPVSVQALDPSKVE